MKMAKKRTATSLVSIFRIALLSGVFVGLIIWGAVRDWDRVFIFAGGAVAVVFVGLIILNCLAKPDEDVKPGKPRLK
jgi:hypothetical protein